MGVMTYSQAGCLALRQEMEANDKVWALGEDVGPEGGVAGQYLGLQKIFGKECHLKSKRIIYIQTLI